MGTTQIKGTFRLSGTMAEAVRGVWGGGGKTPIILDKYY